LIGLLNGVGVTVLRIPPIVMTLGAGGLVEAYLMAVGQLQSTGDQVPRLAVELAANKAGPVPVVTIAWLALAVVASVVLSRTAYGRYVHAVGASDTVARLSGIRVGRVRLLTYAVSGATSAFAGVVLAGYVGTTYLDIGAPYLFTSIAAVVVGGASILGGRGTYWGTVAGSMTLTLLSTILPLFNLSSADLDIVYGAVILVGVWLATNGTVLSNAFRRAIPGIGGQTK
jgi:ribose transport system permease protein